MSEREMCREHSREVLRAQSGSADAKTRCYVCEYEEQIARLTAERDRLLSEFCDVGEKLIALTAERDRLRKLVDEQYVDADQFAGELEQRRKARLQGIREGLEWAGKTVAPKGRVYTAAKAGIVADMKARLADADPEQIAAEADKEAGDGPS